SALNKLSSVGVPTAQNLSIMAFLCLLKQTDPKKCKSLEGPSILPLTKRNVKWTGDLGALQAGHGDLSLIISLDKNKINTK
ncbi:hypothetical protein ACJMK2_013397, partial [Sinanodonta woodiana]